MRNKPSKLEKLGMPEIIEVLSEYQIVLVPGEMLGQGRKNKSFGICDFDSRTIYIDNDRPQNVVMRTIMHEISHAYHFMKKLPDSERNTCRVERNTWQQYQKERK